ncbi:MAG: TlpA family protein disulfide reductase [Planctomycetaceae bacterium]
MRRLAPALLLMAAVGCSQPTPPAPATTGAPGTAAPTETKAVAQAAEEVARQDPAAPAKEMIEEIKEEIAQEVADEEEEMIEEAAEKVAEAEAKGATEPGAEPAPTEDEGPKSVDELLGSLRNPNGPPDINKIASQLEKLLEKEPEHLDGTLTMANIEQIRGRQAAGTEAGKEHFLKSGTYVRKLFKANAEAANNPQIRGFAGVVMYNLACAEALDNRATDAFTTLKEAVGYGFNDLNQMMKDDDLASVRQLPDWAGFETEAKALVKAAAQKEIDSLLAANEPFDFNFELDDIGGKKVSKADFAGKVMIVDIWGTWCPPCRAEIPHFVELDKQFKEKGLQIVGLNKERSGDAEEAAKTVKDFCDENGVTYPCALISDAVMEQVPDFQGFPTTLFIDHTGKVRLKVVGARGPEFLQGVVETLLAEKAAAGTSN